MKHTLETLPPLLDTPEGLWVATATADNWTKLQFITYHGKAILIGSHPDSTEDDMNFPNNLPMDEEWLAAVPNYTASLDAIFAAEARLGLPGDDSIRHIWQDYTEDMLRTITGMYASHQLAFLTAAQRCISFILTAQEVRPS